MSNNVYLVQLILIWNYLSTVCLALMIFSNADSELTDKYIFGELMQLSITRKVHKLVNAAS